MHHQSHSAETPPLDYQQLLHRCLGQAGFAEQILRKFGERFLDDLAGLERDLEAADSHNIARTAHRLKGATASVAAMGLQQIMANIEELGRAGRLPEIATCLEQARREWTRVAACAAALTPLLPAEE